MPLQEISHIAEMVVSIAVIISIIFVAIELRKHLRYSQKVDGGRTADSELDYGTYRYQRRISGFLP